MAGCRNTPGYRAVSQSLSYTIQLEIRQKPVVGNNIATLRITDRKLKPVVPTPVRIDYDIPAMPDGIPTMNYRTEAVQDDTVYRAAMDIPVSGTWRVTVTVGPKGQQEQTHYKLEVH